MKSFTITLNRSTKRISIIVSLFIIFNFSSMNMYANLVNVGTLSASTTWSGTCTSNSCATRGGFDVQYQFVAGVSGSYTFQTCSVMSGDTYLYLSTGSCNAGNLTYNDDGCSAQSTVTYSLTAGSTYYLLLEAYSGDLGAYSIAVTVPVVGPLPGENCSNAQNLATLTSPYSATTAGYADDIATCRTGYPDRIFYISVPNGNTIDIWQTTNSYDSYHYMGYGASCPGTQIYCIDDPDTQNNPWTNTTGSTQTVWFIVDGYSGSGTFTLQWLLTAPILCQTCPAYDYSVTPTTTWQTHSSSIAVSGCKKYSINLTAGNTYLFSACAADGGTASYDSYFQLYNSSCTLVASNDDYCGLQSYISYTPTTTETFYFEVNSCCTGGSSGTYTLAYKYNAPILCQTCPAFDYSITPTTSWQTHSSSIAVSGCKKYSVNLTAGNTYLFSACAADGGTASYDSYFLLYNSSCTLVASNDDYCGLQSYISYTPTTTETFYLEVNSCCTGSSAGTYTLAYKYNSDVTPPTLDAITVNNSCWITDDKHVYSITCQTSDASGIGGPTYGTMALINYQGGSAGSYGGYFAWNSSLATLNNGGFTADQCECAGGGYIGKYPTAYGNSTVTLVSGSTSVSGNQRNVTFYVRPNSTFPALAANDISLYSSDVYGNVAGWLNFETNFSSQTTQQITCPSNIYVCGSQVVTYSAPTSTCNTSVALNAGLASGSTFPVGTNTVTYNTYYPNGAGGSFNYAPGATNQQIALAACESVYGVGNCSIGTCGSFTYYYQTGALSCNCSKPVGSYEFIYSNTGYTQVGQDYGGKSTNVTGNSLFTRVKTSSGCDGNSWSLAEPNLGQGGASCSFTVNVVNVFSAGTITGPAASTQCYNYNPTTLTANPTGGAGTYNYQWQNSPNGSAWSDIGGATTSTYDPPALTSTTYYRVLVDPTGTPDCAAATASTNTLIYTIRPDFTAGAINTTGETICYDGNPALIGSTTAASGGDNTITYEWRANGTAIGSTNSATYDPPANLTATTTYTRWAHDGTCNLGWTQSTGSWVVTVRPNFTPGAINTTGETICYDGDPAVIGSTTASSGGDNSINYEWRANGTSIGSTNSATYDPPANLTATTTYTRWAKDATCSTSFTQSTGSWVVTVRPEFTPGSINAAGETICHGDDPANIASSVASSGGDNIITYKWQANGVDIAASNAANYNPPAGLLENTTYTRWAKDNTCNTSWTQSTGSWLVTVTQAPYPAGIAAGDYFWTGADNTSWDDTDNWLYYDGTDYSVATVLPTVASDVFIQSYSGTCATTNAITSAASTVYCEDLNIQTGLTLGGLSTIEVTGDWNNSGTFVSGTGTVIFNGSAVQTINSGGSSFNNILFDNSSAGNADIAIAAPMSILGAATFTDGIVYFLGTGSLTFGNTATASVSSNNSFVDGTVVKTGASAFIFPTGDVVTRDIGDGALTYVVLGAVGATPDAATTASVLYSFSNSGMPDWWEHGGNMDATLHHVSDRENWLISAQENLSNLTLYWYDNSHALIDACIHGFDLGDSGDFDPADLSVSYWSTSIWRDAAGVVSGAHDQGEITCAVVPFSGAKNQTFITFGSKADKNPLPVELTSFVGKCDEGKATIEWKTASETNNDYFLLEKSVDMINFNIVEKVTGAGNSNLVNNYTVSDFTQTDKTYYRLVQVDFDGETKVYPIIIVNCESTSVVPTVTVYPNPFNSELMVLIENLNEESASLQIIDELGQIVYEEKASVDAYNALIKLDLGSLKPAVYHLRIISDDHLLNKKIIKK